MTMTMTATAYFSSAGEVPMLDETAAHATRSPSSAHRWLRCPDSINAERGLPDKVGIEAAEGTLFHSFAERALLFGLDPHDFETGRETEIDGHTVSYNDEMIDSMYEGLEWIYGEMADEEAQLFVEVRVEIAPWTLEKGGFGTSDVIIVFPKQRRIIVFDWKYGLVGVTPEKNDQATLYGLGVWKTIASKIFDDDPSNIRVDIMICQPRIPGGGGLWTTTMKKLLKEGENIKFAAARTYEENPPRIPGLKQCRYCKAKATCGALAKYNLELFSLKFEDLDADVETEPELPEIEDLTMERLAYILLHKGVFTKWLDALNTHLKAAAKRGEKIPGMKHVKGRAGKRTFFENQIEEIEEILVEELGDEAHETKLITPAAAEKIMGKARFKELLKGKFTQPDPAPILVPDTDGREALTPNAMKFDDEDGAIDD